MFDDAAIFPPGNAPIERAVRDHWARRSSWYADYVGPFVCSIELLDRVERALTDAGGDVLDVTVTAARGPAALAGIGPAAEVFTHVRIVALEVALKDYAPAGVAAVLRDCGLLRTAYVEVPVPDVVEGLVADLVAAGLRLKLRTGGVTAAAFPDDGALANAIHTAVRGGVAFKCTAGLHNAIRHRDPTTGFEHHGFLNVALAAQAALDGASVDGVRARLADSDADRVKARIGDLTDAEVMDLRRQFTSFGTCSVLEPLADLHALGLIGGQ